MVTWNVFRVQWQGRRLASLLLTLAVVVVEMKGFIVFACAVVVVCAVAVWFAATHSAKCIKYAERDEFLYMMLVGGVMVPVYDKPCLVYESGVQK